MGISIDNFALFILLGVFLLLALCKKFLFQSSASPSLSFSKVGDLKFATWRSNLCRYPKKFHTAALFFFGLAFLNPQIPLVKSDAFKTKQIQIKELPTEGIAIYLALDRSGSMSEKVKAMDKNGSVVLTSKIDLLKEVTKQFILDHPSDLLGIATFARVPRIIVPLTLDQETLLDKLNKIEVVKSAEDDGTAIGYAIFKTANLIAATRHFAEDLRKGGKSPYTIKSAVIIAVTDGFQDPSKLDYGNRLRTLELDDAAKYAKSQGIRLYVINIDPSLGTPEFAPERKQLQTITNLTGGKFYLVDESADLQEIYDDIGRLEKGAIIRKGALREKEKLSYLFPLYPYLIGIGLFFLLSSLLLENLILKRIP